MSAVRGFSLVVVTLVLGWGAVSVVPAAVAQDDQDGNVSVVVTDGPEPTPTPTISLPQVSTPPLILPPATGGPKGSSNVQQATVTPAGSEQALGPDAVGVDGVFSMSGLTASIAPSFTPGNGTVTLTFSVRNSSKEAFDSNAKIWVDTAWGTRVSELEGISVAGLQPEETRRVSATIDDLGQTTLLNAHVTFTPPKEVAGTSLEPITRDTFVAFPPVFALLVIGGVAGIGGLGWWLYRRVRWGAPRAMTVAGVGA